MLLGERAQPGKRRADLMLEPTGPTGEPVEKQHNRRCVHRLKAFADEGAGLGGNEVVRPTRSRTGPMPCGIREAPVGIQDLNSAGRGPPHGSPAIRPAKPGSNSRRTTATQPGAAGALRAPLPHPSDIGERLPDVVCAGGRVPDHRTADRRGQGGQHCRHRAHPSPWASTSCIPISPISQRVSPSRAVIDERSAFAEQRP